MMPQARIELDHLLTTVEKPLVIFDLDGTIFDVTHRTIEIVNRFIATPKIADEFKEQIDLVKSLKYEDYQYSLEGTLQNAGIDRYSEKNIEFLHKAIGFWYKNFFRDALLEFDIPLPGSKECVTHCHNSGAHIVYLSGRDTPNMSRGTLAALERHGFPHTGSKVSVYLKPSYGLNDLYFKRHAIEAIQHFGDVISTFDNEPANVKLFVEGFPNALNFHVDTLFAKKIELKGKNLRTIKNFCELGFQGN